MLTQKITQIFNQAKVIQTVRQSVQDVMWSFKDGNREILRRAHSNGLKRGAVLLGVSTYMSAGFFGTVGSIMAGPAGGVVGVAAGAALPTTLIEGAMFINSYSRRPSKNTSKPSGPNHNIA